jgi:hypothetical protein
MCRDNAPVETEDYRGFTIEIFRDEDGGNPWKDMDGNPPIAVYYDRGITEYATKYGHANELPELTREQMHAHKAEIASLLGFGTLYQAAKASMGGYRDTAEDAIHEALRNHLEYNRSDRERLEALESLWNMAGVPAVLGTSTGYSQGDYAYVLAVATPEFLKAMGSDAETWSADNFRALRDSIRLYGYWAWGDVYGYVVEDEDGETLDSCWGYYGDYKSSEWEYMLSEARSAVDYRIEDERRAKIEQVKTWIRNRVPFQYRRIA